MARVTNLKRLKAEDFEQDDQALVEKLALNLNPFLEEVSSAFNGNISFENMAQEALSLDIEVDSLGKPKRKVEVKSSLKTRIRGIQVISVTNNTDNAFPTGAPFITYGIITNGFEIKHVTGLLADKKYTINIIVIG